MSQPLRSLFCFPSLHLALFVLTVQCLSLSLSQSSGPGHGWTSEGLKNKALVPIGRLTSAFLCVFQGSAGA